MFGLHFLVADRFLPLWSDPAQAMSKSFQHMSDNLVGWLRLRTPSEAPNAQGSAPFPFQQVAHLTELVVALTKAAGPDNSDAAVGAELVTADATIAAGESVQVLGDSAYGTGAMLAALDEAGHVPVIKPWPLRPAVPGGFTIADFAHDPVAGTVTCPAGNVRKVTAYGRATFKAACRSCPLKTQCTTSAEGRTVVLHEHDLLQRAHRERATDPDFQATYRTLRPMVERTIAWVTRGNRRVPFRGVVKNNAWLHHRVAALNLRRLLALGLTRNNQGWALT
jgi:hypothetical protein